MKVCVFGVGAIGGLLGYGLGKAGWELSGVARGKVLSALREKGLGFSGPGGLDSVPIRASEDPAELGPQDLVILAVKAPALAQAAPRVAPLLGPETIILPAMNGVPWWFFRGGRPGFGGEIEGASLDSVDPDGSIARALPPSRVLGCVVHLGASCPEPGVVSSLPLKRIIVGEPSGERTARLELVSEALAAAGFEVEVSASIQREIWYKLWGNMTMNPLSALTGATMDKINDDPLVASFCMDVMAEAKRIGARIGCPIEETEADRMAVSRKLGAFKTSMLQDVEAGRPIELDALVSSVKEIAVRLGEKTPAIDVMLGLTRLKARTIGLYPPA